MGPTMSLLAAGLLAAQTADPAATGAAKTCPCQKNATSAGVIQPVAQTPDRPIVGRLFRNNGDAVTEDRPSLFSRIQGMFKKDDAAPIVTSEPPLEQPKAAPTRLMQRLPSGATSQAAPASMQPMPVAAAPVKVQPVTYQAVPANQPTAAASTIASPITQTVAMPSSRPNRVSPDLVGKIGHETDYSWITGQLHIENGNYVIHYATPEVVDQYNGSLVLTTTQDLRGYQDGDFVSVRGTVAGSASGRSMYRLTGIDRLPR